MLYLKKYLLWLDKILSLKVHNKKPRKPRKVFNQIIVVIRVDILESYTRIKVEDEYRGIFIDK